MSKFALKSNSHVARFGGKARVASALTALLLGPGLSGCILGSERPELGREVPPAYREASSHAPDAAVPALDWWRGFRSSELTSLMQEAQIYNLDVAVAIAQEDAGIVVQHVDGLVTFADNAEQSRDRVRIRDVGLKRYSIAADTRGDAGRLADVVVDEDDGCTAIGHGSRGSRAETTRHSEASRESSPTKAGAVLAAPRANR